MDEPTAATTQPITKTSEGDYAQIKQTNTTNAPMDVVEEEQDDNGESILSFIQLKYCTVCHLEIPIRAKHCKKCDHCVGTHDHHCPWVGNCIGERNKIKFYVYLWIQLFQIGFLILLASFLLYDLQD